ncbi:MAG: D-aminoacylase [Thermomicrobiales bacterium]|nr:D-aminoacylase [Thermomicrobiales bacterium]
MEFDLLIMNGQVVDGSGAPRRRADVGISGDKVAAIGDLAGSTAATTIDATGKAVAPGFIDVHVHSEVALADTANPHRFGSVLQGVTTHLTGPDGFGWAPLPPDRARELWDSTLFAYGETEVAFDWSSPERYLAAFTGVTPINVVPQVPHCAVRLAAMGWDARPATDDELDRMRAITRDWMEAGAVALNLGLDYQPSAYADTRELIELSKVAREYDGVYAAHIRYAILGQVEAWRETMTIARESGIPVHISHENVDDITEPLLIEAEGDVDLTFESYCYPAGCTHLALMLPTWAQAGGPDVMRDRLRDPETRRQLRDYLQEVLPGPASKPSTVLVANQTGRYIGRNLVEIAETEGVSIGEIAVRLLEEEHPYALMVYHRGFTPEEQVEAVRRTLRHPRMLVASDGFYHGQSSHPRGFGCFARILRHGVRELGAISLEEAVHKMTGFPAERFRVKERGLLSEGFAADVVIFDPETVADRATWEEPRLEPVGIDRVIVNGVTVVDRGIPTGALPGRVVR